MSLEGLLRDGQHGGGRAAHILLVDDDRALLVVMELLLTAQGHKVTAATNGARALDLFAADPQGYDLLITDQIMPSMTGVEMAQTMRAMRPGLRVMFITGYSEAIGPDALTDLGIETVLTKPFGSRELSQAVKQALSG